MAKNGEGAAATRSLRNIILSQDSLVPLGFVLMLLGGAYAFGQYTQAQQNDRKQQADFQAQSLQRDAELRSMIEKAMPRSEFEAWSRVLRAGVPPELRSAIPEAPR